MCVQDRAPGAWAEEREGVGVALDLGSAAMMKQQATEKGKGVSGAPLLTQESPLKLPGRPLRPREEGTPHPQQNPLPLHVPLPAWRPPPERPH